MIAREKLQHALTRAFIPKLPLRRLPVQLERYLEHEAVRRLGWAPGRHPVELLGSGRNQMVRRWRVPGQAPVFARAWRYDLRTRPAREHLTAGRLFRQAGLTVPEVIHYDDCLRTICRWRIEVIIERAAGGEPLEALLAQRRLPEAKILHQFGEQLASLHLHRTDQGWGRPWRAENEWADPQAYLATRLEKLADRLPGRTERLETGEILGRLDYLARRFGELRLGAIEPGLVHGDLSAAHVFYQAPDKLTWIDFGTVHYGHPAEDLAMIKRWSDDPRLLEGVVEGYRTGGGAVEFADEPILDFYIEWRLWERLSSRLLKRLRRAEGTNPKRAAELLREQRAIEAELLGRLRRASLPA